MARRYYTFFFYLVLPLILLRLIYRAVRAPAYANRILERFGLFSALPVEHCIWIHAVSVGETIAALPLVEYLQQQHPQKPIVVTTMTPTGSERVRAQFGDAVFHVYAPYDLPGSIKRFLQRIKPELLIIMETELWPNTIHYCYKNAVPVIVANARLSEKSAKGYRRFPSLSHSMLQQITTVAAQYSMDGERFVELGLPEDQLSVTGSIKFDISLSEQLKQKAAELKSQLQYGNLEGKGTGGEKRTVFLAASTHEGEDELLINAFKDVADDSLLLILVPRHPERFAKVAALCKRSGLETVLRSSGLAVRNETQVLVGDTMGELLLICGCADIVFVGGSLVENGGHNMLEAAVWGLPIISGSSVYNFLEISEKLQQSNGLVLVKDGEELSKQLTSLLTDKEKRQHMGQGALQVVEQNRGALQRLLTIIEQSLQKK